MAIKTKITDLPQTTAEATPNMVILTATATSNYQVPLSNLSSKLEQTAQEALAQQGVILINSVKKNIPYRTKNYGDVYLIKSQGKMELYVDKNIIDKQINISTNTGTLEYAVNPEQFSSYLTLSSNKKTLTGIIPRPHPPAVFPDKIKLTVVQKISSAKTNRYLLLKYVYNPDTASGIWQQMKLFDGMRFICQSDIRTQYIYHKGVEKDFLQRIERNLDFDIIEFLSANVADPRVNKYTAYTQYTTAIRSSKPQRAAGRKIKGSKKSQLKVKSINLSALLDNRRVKFTRFVRTTGIKRNQGINSYNQFRDFTVIPFDKSLKIKHIRVFYQKNKTTGKWFMRTFQEIK
ncbi:MAG: hypothetical protein LBV69_04380 [Bacteroidales bacterium]|jgi:hypothetical protein|nr:hypothetical protein [Bacteroidales bacterium]